MNLTLEGLAKIVDVEEEIVLGIAEKYGAEYLGTEYGEKWFENRITFFYPGYMMNNPQMFGTIDSTATYDKIEKIHGMNIIIVTTAKTDEEARALLKLMGMPFSA